MYILLGEAHVEPSLIATPTSDVSHRYANDRWPVDRLSSDRCDRTPVEKPETYSPRCCVSPTSRTSLGEGHASSRLPRATANILSTSASIRRAEAPVTSAASHLRWNEEHALILNVGQARGRGRHCMQRMTRTGVAVASTPSSCTTKSAGCRQPLQHGYTKLGPYP